MRPIKIALLVAAVTAAVACGSSSGDDDVDGKYELYVNSDYLDTIQLTFLKGRCVARSSIDTKETAAETALLAFGRYLADSIPLDGSQPADDDALTALLPVPPLSGAITGWLDDGGEAWLVTTDAFDWINGSGPPFDDNGFEAVAGDGYTHDPEGWLLEIELVNMGDPTGAEAAFRGASWDMGTQHE